MCVLFRTPSFSSQALILLGKGVSKQGDGYSQPVQLIILVGICAGSVTRFLPCQLLTILCWSWT
jgi:hypothetical protein